MNTAVTARCKYVNPVTEVFPGECERIMAGSPSDSPNFEEPSTDAVDVYLNSGVVDPSQALGKRHRSLWDD